MAKKIKLKTFGLFYMSVIWKAPSDTLWDYIVSMYYKMINSTKNHSIAKEFNKNEIIKIDDHKWNIYSLATKKELT